MMSAVATSPAPSSQGINAALPRSLSMKMSVSMSQGIVFFLFQAGEFLFNCVGGLGIRCVVGEQRCGAFSVHEPAVRNEASDNSSVFDDLQGLPVFNFAEVLTKLSCHGSCGCLFHSV